MRRETTKKVDASDIIHIVRDNLSTNNNDNNNNKVNACKPVICRSYEFRNDRGTMLHHGGSNTSHPYESLQERVSNVSDDPAVVELRLIKELIADTNSRDEVEEEWTHLAKVLDRLCFILFIIAYSVVSFVMLLPPYLVVHDSIH